MLEIYICEDEANIRKKMAKVIGDFALVSELDTELVLTTGNPSLILDSYKNTNNPVLFFLDIDLGTEMNGIELAEKIRAENKEAFLVFFTTKSEMAPLTFKYQLEALEFITKDDAEEEIRKRIINSIKTAVTRSTKSSSGKIYQIKHDDKLIMLPMNDILYIETTPIRYKLNLHTTRRRLTISGELKKIEGELDDSFIRIHQSYLVNRNQIMTIDFPKALLTLYDGSELPISRSGRKLLR